MNDKLRGLIQSFVCGIGMTVFFEVLTYMLLDIIGVIK